MVNGGIQGNILSPMAAAVINFRVRFGSRLLSQEHHLQITGLHPGFGWVYCET